MHKKPCHCCHLSLYHIESRGDSDHTRIWLEVEWQNSHPIALCLIEQEPPAPCNLPCQKCSQTPPWDIFLWSSLRLVNSSTFMRWSATKHMDSSSATCPYSSSSWNSLMLLPHGIPNQKVVWSWFIWVWTFDFIPPHGTKDNSVTHITALPKTSPPRVFQIVKNFQRIFYLEKYAWSLSRHHL